MMLFISSFVWPFLGIQLYRWLGMIFFWLFHSSVDFVWPFRRLSTKLIRPDKFIWISSWLKQNLGDLNWFNSRLKRLSRNWLRINSWLEWIPGYWFRWAHDSKCLPIFDLSQLMTRRKKNYSESTHDSTLSHTHCLPDIASTSHCCNRHISFVTLHDVLISNR